MSNLTKNRRRKSKGGGFQWAPFSLKQKQVLMWWMPESPWKEYDIMIAEGAIRSGKTVSMIDSFLLWSQECHQYQSFIVAGKTAGALKRNVISPLIAMLIDKKIPFQYNRSEGFMEIGTNVYYFFGAANEASQDVLQGLTAAGAYADEVALMPKSFVNQMIGRCSVEGAKIFLNCNPQGPYHWFKEEFIDKAAEKHGLVLHFDMNDNLTLSEKVKDRYKRMFTGVFYMRNILGLWVMAEGIIHDMFDRERHVVPTVPRKYIQHYVSVDYGTKNATAFGLWGLYNDKWYKIKEYHYDGRAMNKQKTDKQYSNDLQDFVGDLYVQVIVDPSAASFIAQIKEDGFHVIPGNNEVIDGIRNVGQALSEDMVRYNDVCRETFREFASYVWDEKASLRGEDIPIKQNDHHMDADRYFIRTIVFSTQGWFSDQNAW